MTEPIARRPSLGIAIPCHNEATTIAKVVADFRAACPEAVVYVFDNASTDGTGAIAKAAGAVVVANFDAKKSIDVQVALDNSGRLATVVTAENPAPRSTTGAAELPPRSAAVFLEG